MARDGAGEASSVEGVKPKRKQRPPRQWTKRRTEMFLATLGYSGNISEAIRACGMSSSAVYERRKADGEFRRSWEQALLGAYDRLEGRMLDEGLNGVPVKIRHLGKVVDEEIRFDTKTSLTLLHLHRRTVERLREEAQSECKDREALERELNARLDLIEARLNGTPEPGQDAAGD